MLWTLLTSLKPTSSAEHFNNPFKRLIWEQRRESLCIRQRREFQNLIVHIHPVTPMHICPRIKECFGDLQAREICVIRENPRFRQLPPPKHQNIVMLSAGCELVFEPTFTGKSSGFQYRRLLLSTTVNITLNLCVRKRYS